MQSPTPFLAPRGAAVSRPLPPAQLPAPMPLAQSGTPRRSAQTIPTTDVVHTRGDVSRGEMWAAFQVVLLVLVLSVLAVMFMSSSGSSPKADAKVAVVLNEAGTLAAAGKYGEAQVLLDSVQGEVGTEPMTLVKAARVREQITNGSLAAQAAQREASGDTVGALALYRRVLVRNPDHADSLAAVARLTQPKTGSQRAARNLDAPPPSSATPRYEASQASEEDLATAWKKLRRRRW